MTHLARSPLLALVTGGWLAACTEAPRPVQGEQERRGEARAGGEALAVAMRENAVTAACGAALPGERPRLALLVNARQAMSCRDLGYLLRRVRPGSQGTTMPWVPVPAADTAAVCPFLRQEKVRLPVAALTRANDDLSDISTLIMARVAADGIDTAYFAPTGKEVLLQFQRDTSNATALVAPIPSR